MQNQKIALAVYGAVVFVGLFIAFMVGLYVGADQLLKMDSSAKAALLVHDLQAIRSGTNEKLIKVKEVQLDGEIAQALRYQEFGHPWLFWPFSESYDHEKYLRTVAQYRKEYPSPTATLELGGDDEQKRNMEGYRAEVVTQTTQLIERYGK
jgi:hypothetical protein